MTIDFRALCAELADELDAETGYTKNDGERITHLAVARARAALATPTPEPPTDEEIMGLMPQQMHEDLATAVRAMAEQAGIDSTPAKGIMRIILNRHIVDLARAALERWGHG